jgi:hypothetical protein
VVKELQLCTETRLPTQKHIMIIVWLGDSVKEYGARLLQALGRLALLCPVCSGRCHWHGWYHRKVRSEEGVQFVRVLRVKCCGCNRTHVVLPDFLAPHKQYIQQIRESALQACLEDGAPAERATWGDRVVATTRRWLRDFKARFYELAGALVSMRMRVSPVNETDYRIRGRTVSALSGLCNQVCRLLGGRIVHSCVLGLVNQIMSLGGLGVWC